MRSKKTTDERVMAADTRRGSSERERKYHYRVRAGATCKLGELLGEFGDDMPPELRRELLDMQDELNPKTDNDR